MDEMAVGNKLSKLWLMGRKPDSPGLLRKNFSSVKQKKLLLIYFLCVCALLGLSATFAGGIFFYTGSPSKVNLRFLDLPALSNPRIATPKRSIFTSSTQSSPEFSNVSGFFMSWKNFQAFVLQRFENFHFEPVPVAVGSPLQGLTTRSLNQKNFKARENFMARNFPSVYNRGFPNNQMSQSNNLSKFRLAAEGEVGSAADENADRQRVIDISSPALEHLKSLKNKLADGNQLFLRMGVKSGGCSGLSYTMDIIQQSDIKDGDYVERCEEPGVHCVIDPKSLLYLFGMELDYSDELIGGGFRFHNPNASKSCGCGMSFGVPKDFADMAISMKPKRCS